MSSHLLKQPFVEIVDSEPDVIEISSTSHEDSEPELNIVESDEDEPLLTVPKKSRHSQEHRQHKATAYSKPAESADHSESLVVEHDDINTTTILPRNETLHSPDRSNNIPELDTHFNGHVRSIGVNANQRLPVENALNRKSSQTEKEPQTREEEPHLSRIYLSSDDNEMTDIRFSIPQSTQNEPVQRKNTSSIFTLDSSDSKKDNASYLGGLMNNIFNPARLFNKSKPSTKGSQSTDESNAFPSKNKHPTSTIVNENTRIETLRKNANKKSPKKSVQFISPIAKPPTPASTASCSQKIFLTQESPAKLSSQSQSQPQSQIQTQVIEDSTCSETSASQTQSQVTSQVNTQSQVTSQVNTQSQFRNPNLLPTQAASQIQTQAATQTQTDVPETDVSISEVINESTFNRANTENNNNLTRLPRRPKLRARDERLDTSPERTDASPIDLFGKHSPLPALQPPATSPPPIVESPVFFKTTPPKPVLPDNESASTAPELSVPKPLLPIPILLDSTSPEPTPEPAEPSSQPPIPIQQAASPKSITLTPLPRQIRLRAQNPLLVAFQDKDTPIPDLIIQKQRSPRNSRLKKVRKPFESSSSDDEYESRSRLKSLTPTKSRIVSGGLGTISKDKIRNITSTQVFATENFKMDDNLMLQSHGGLFDDNNLITQKNDVPTKAQNLKETESSVNENDNRSISSTSFTTPKKKTLFVTFKFPARKIKINDLLNSPQKVTREATIPIVKEADINATVLTETSVKANSPEIHSGHEISSSTTEIENSSPRTELEVEPAQEIGNHQSDIQPIEEPPAVFEQVNHFVPEIEDIEAAAENNMHSGLLKNDTEDKLNADNHEEVQPAIPAIPATQDLNPRKLISKLHGDDADTQSTQLLTGLLDYYDDQFQNDDEFAAEAEAEPLHQPQYEFQTQHIINYDLSTVTAVTRFEDNDHGITSKLFVPEDDDSDISEIESNVDIDIVDLADAAADAAADASINALFNESDVGTLAYDDSLPPLPPPPFPPLPKTVDPQVLAKNDRLSKRVQLKKLREADRYLPYSENSSEEEEADEENSDEDSIIAKKRGKPEDFIVDDDNVEYESQEDSGDELTKREKITRVSKHKHKSKSPEVDVSKPHKRPIVSDDEDEALKEVNPLKKMKITDQPSNLTKALKNLEFSDNEFRDLDNLERSDRRSVRKKKKRKPIVPVNNDSIIVLDSESDSDEIVGRQPPRYLIKPSLQKLKSLRQSPRNNDLEQLTFTGRNIQKPKIEETKSLSKSDLVSKLQDLSFKKTKINSIPVDDDDVDTSDKKVKNLNIEKKVPGAPTNPTKQKPNTIDCMRCGRNPGLRHPCNRAAICNNCIIRGLPCGYTKESMKDNVEKKVTPRPVCNTCLNNTNRQLRATCDGKRVCNNCIRGKTRCLWRGPSLSKQQVESNSHNNRNHNIPKKLTPQQQQERNIMLLNSINSNLRNDNPKVRRRPDDFRRRQSVRNQNGFPRGPHNRR